MYELRDRVPIEDRPNWEPLSFPKIAYLVNLDRTSCEKAYKVHKSRLRAQPGSPANVALASESET